MLKTILLSTMFCTFSISAIHSHADPIVPLAIGNQWAYIINGDPSKKSVSKIIQSEEINGTTWFLLEEFGELFWVSDRPTGQYEALGSFGLTELNKNNLEQELVLQKYTDKKVEYTFSGNKVTVDSCREKIVVPAGTFDCIMYIFDLGEGDISTSYYSNNVGLIKNIYKTKNVSEFSELTSFSVQERKN